MLYRLVMYSKFKSWVLAYFLNLEKIESSKQTPTVDDYRLIHEKLDKILNFLASKPLSKKEMSDFAAVDIKDAKESISIPTNTATSTTEVAPSATSIAGAVTPRRSTGTDHPRPTLEVGKSPSAPLNSQNQPVMVPHQITLPSGQAYFPGREHSYGYETQGSTPRPNWGQPPQHPGPGAQYPNQYPVQGRPYYPPVNPNRPPPPNSGSYPGYNGN